jgi:ketosteroid isomerase-like protein
MASTPNVALVRGALNALNGRDVEAALELFAPEVEVDWSRSLGPLRGVYRGHEGVRYLWAEFWGAFAEIHVQADEYVTVGSHVLVPNTAHLRGRDGVGVTARSTFQYTVGRGRVTVFRMFATLHEARAAIETSCDDV